jgi:formylglycine-generating enzyme required for sulfatase activity
MRITFITVLLAASLHIGSAAAQSDPLQCRSYASQIMQARDSRERLNELLNHPRSSDCPNAAAQARAYLRALAPAPTQGPARTDAGEPAAWQLAARINSRAAYQAYLDQYPSGANAAEARRRVRVMTTATQDRPAATTTPPQTASSTPAEQAPTRSASLREFDDCNGEAWCPRMVTIPGGAYSIGSPATERGRRSDESQRPITLRSFAIGKFELTAEQWSACVQAAGCSRATTGTGRQAATYIDWNDAQQYVQWLSQRTGQAYRLPSEAEWEYAARGGTTTAYWWGDDAPVCQAGQRNSATFGTCPLGPNLTVGRFEPNPFGLYDVAGNVWEIVQDCYAPLGSMPADGTANVRNDCDVNRGLAGVGARGMTTVSRGGSWIDAATRLRSADRQPIYRTYRHRHIGIRVARDL